MAFIRPIRGDRLSVIDVLLSENSDTLPSLLVTARPQPDRQDRKKYCIYFTPLEE
jgi:hypothetical protein